MIFLRFLEKFGKEIILGFGLAALLVNLMEGFYLVPNLGGFLDVILFFALLLVVIHSKFSTVSTLQKLSGASVVCLMVKHIALFIFPPDWYFQVIGLLFGATVGAMLFLILGTLSLIKMKEKDLLTHEGGEYPFFLDTEKKVFISSETFKYQLQVCGTTGMGKSVALKNIMEQAIKYGLGVFIFDAKSNFTNDVLYYAQVYGRKSALRYFDVSNLSRSQTYNVIFRDDPDELFNGIKTFLYGTAENQNDYFSTKASALLSSLSALFYKEYKSVTVYDYFHAIVEELTSCNTVEYLVEKYENSALKAQANYLKEIWLEKKAEDREKEFSGLIDKLHRYCARQWSPLINCKHPHILMKEVMDKGQIFLFATSALTNMEDSKPLVVAALTDIAAQVGKRLQMKEKPKKPFLVILDEFYNVAYPGFVDLLNKARDANVVFILAHQSVGDLKMVSEEFSEQILGLTNHKIILNINNPATVDYFARLFGTKSGAPKKVYSYDTRTGDPAGYTEKIEEEFNYHPNLFKELKRGEAIARLFFPESGFKRYQIKLQMPTPIGTTFDIASLLPIRNDHLKENQYNQVGYAETVTHTKVQPDFEPLSPPAPKEEGLEDPLGHSEIFKPESKTKTKEKAIIEKINATIKKTVQKKIGKKHEPDAGSEAQPTDH